MSPWGAAGTGQRFGGQAASPLPFNRKKHGIPAARGSSTVSAGPGWGAEQTRTERLLSSAPAASPLEPQASPAGDKHTCPRCHRAPPCALPWGPAVREEERGDVTDLLRPRRGLPRAAPGRALRGSHSNIAARGLGAGARSRQPGECSCRLRPAGEPAAPLAGDKAGSEQPSTERLCPAGARPPPPPANRACKRPGEAKKHFHSPWEEKNCYSPFTKIFLVFLPLAAAGSDACHRMNGSDGPLARAWAAFLTPGLRTATACASKGLFCQACTSHVHLVCQCVFRWTWVWKPPKADRLLLSTAVVRLPSHHLTAFHISLQSPLRCHQFRGQIACFEGCNCIF